jgi:hypothetical protein
MLRAAPTNAASAALLAGLAIPAAWPQNRQEPGEAFAPFLASASTAFVLDNARIVDGTGAPAQIGWSLAIEDGIISALGPSGSITVPATAERLDLAGHTILPGLISLYEPMSLMSGNRSADTSPVNDVADPHPSSVPKLLLAAGVTTARTAGWNVQVELNLKRRIDAGALVGPTLFVTGPYLSAPGDDRLDDFVIETPQEARDVVRFWVGRGSTSVTVTGLDAASIAAAVDEAHRLGAQVAGDLGFGGSCIEAARLGVDTITRAFGSCIGDVPPPTATDGRAAESNALLDTLHAHDVVLVYTPFAWPPTDEELALLTAQQRELYNAFVASPPPLFEALILSPPDPDVRFAVNLYAEFMEAGGTILMGSVAGDGGNVAGYAFHRGLLAVAGTRSRMPLEIISIATRDAAAFLGIGDRTGRVEAGLQADLLIVRGAPDIEMSDVRNVAYVFKDGRAYDPGKLREAARGLVGLH